MGTMLNPEERRLFSQILEYEAKRIGGKWFIDGDGTVSDLEEVIDAMFEGRLIQLKQMKD
jgi:hypothetical protein